MNIDLKRQIYSLKEVSKLFICNENLVKKNEILKAQVIILNFTLTRFTKGNENLNIVLGNQRYVFKKSGLGYNPKKNKKTFTQTYLLKASTSLNLYNSYGKNGFHEKYCMHKNILSKVKHIWVSKNTFTNQNGSMRLWVPKPNC